MPTYLAKLLQSNGKSLELQFLSAVRNVLDSVFIIWGRAFGLDTGKNRKPSRKPKKEKH